MNTAQGIWVLVGLLVILLLTARFIRSVLRREGSLGRRLLGWIKDVFDALFGMS